jgi:hypothetical protein
VKRVSQIAFRKCGRSRRTDVDHPVEDVERLGGCHGGVDDNSLAGGKSSDLLVGNGGLVVQERSDDGLDEAGGEGENENGDDEGSDGMALLDDLRDTSHDENRVGEDTDKGSDPESLVPTPHGVLGRAGGGRDGSGRDARARSNIARITYREDTGGDGQNIRKELEKYSNGFKSDCEKCVVSLSAFAMPLGRVDTLLPVAV